MPWRRSGECCRCGECCIGDPFDDASRPRTAAVAGYCPLFYWRGSGEGHCLGHSGAVPPGQEHPYYMAGCNVWPDHPDLIADKPHCTYRFTWVD
jgi:hypothetical protein